MQTNRLFQIVYYLLCKGKCTAPELAERFEVSVRTIYRDLDAISAAGIPVYAAQGKGGGIAILPEYVLGNALLSGEEKEKIMMALEGLAAADVETDGLLSKLGALFQTKVSNWIEVDFSDWKRKKTGQDVFDTIKTAIFQKSLIFFSYFGNSGFYSERTVEPMKLVFKSKDWYLYGFCRLRQDFRFFKLTRINNLTLCEETFVRETPDSVQMAPSTIVEPVVSVKLKFSPEAAFRVYDEFTDAVTADNQGNLYVTADLPDNGVLFSYLLSFGNQVEVLEPACIQEQMKEKPNPLYEEIRFGTMGDGLCVEILHVGPFDDEPASFEKMDRFAEAQGVRRLEDSHREIYLSNANRVEKEKLKTILRYAVAKIL